MKHLKLATRKPSMAEIDHPGLVESITGLLQDPIGVLAFHVDYILSKFRTPSLLD